MDWADGIPGLAKASLPDWGGPGGRVAWVRVGPGRGWSGRRAGWAACTRLARGGPRGFPKGGVFLRAWEGFCQVRGFFRVGAF